MIWRFVDCGIQDFRDLGIWRFANLRLEGFRDFDIQIWELTNSGICDMDFRYYGIQGLRDKYIYAFGNLQILKFIDLNVCEFEDLGIQIFGMLQIQGSSDIWLFEFKIQELVFMDLKLRGFGD